MNGCELRPGEPVAMIGPDHRPRAAMPEPVAGGPSDVVFVYSGHGSRSGSAMGRRLLATEPVFADAIEDLDAIFQWEHDCSLREIFAGRRGLDDLAVGQSALLAVQVGLTALWRAHGVEPTAVLGQSTGEVAAAVAAGALNLTDAFRIMARRTGPLASTGGGAVGLAELTEGELATRFAGLRPAPPRLPFYSTVLADPRERPDFDPGYWAANLRRPARLPQAIGAALADGHTTFLEISARPVAISAVEQTIAEITTAGCPPVRTLPSLRRDQDEQVTFRSSLAVLHALAGGGSGTEAGAA